MVNVLMDIAGIKSNGFHLKRDEMERLTTAAFAEAAFIIFTIANVSGNTAWPSTGIGIKTRWKINNFNHNQTGFFLRRLKKEFCE